MISEKYLIYRDLEYALKRGFSITRIYSANIGRVYIVFNVLKDSKSSKEVLVFNYIEYCDLFLDSLYAYSILVQYHHILNDLISDYLMITDNQIMGIKYIFIILRY